MKRNQGLPQRFRRRISGTPILCQESEKWHQTGKVSISCARWPLLFAQAIPRGERDSDVILLIKKIEIVEITGLATYSTNLGKPC